VRILTHNAYWFQGCPSRWGRERAAEAPKVVQALTDLYRSASPDVVCLQEVPGAALARDMSQALSLPEWVHAAGGLRPPYGGAILCGRGACLRDCTRGDGRPPHDRVHLRAGVACTGDRLEVAAIHLPSNRFAESPEAGDAARVTELAWVLAESPRPTVIVGDLNCLPGSPPYRVLEKAGYVDAAAAAGAPDAAARRVDYTWLDADLAGRLVRFAVLDDGPFRRQDAAGNAWRLSDHPPLVVEVQ